MSCNWPEVTIEAIASKLPNALATGPFGSAISSKFFTDSGFPVIRGSNLSTDMGIRLKDKGIVFVSEEKAKEFKRSVAREGDLIFTCWGTINQVGYLDGTSNWDEYIISNKQMKLTVDTAKVDPRFLYYVFSSPSKQQEILSNGIGAAVPGFNLGQLKKHTLRLPPLDIQSAIADTLELLDKKANRNTQTNQTLEQMAQAIFKSWFVDFDPVKAKMNGEQPKGMDAATASLFPEKLVESELGLIPEGWELKQLKDVLELAYGKALKKTDRVEGDVPVYGSGGLTGYHNQSLVDGPGIIVGRKGTVGSVYWEPKAFYPIDTVFYVKPKAGYSLNYCHLILQNLGLKDMNTDAAVPGLNRNNAYRLDVITPNEAVLIKFEEITQSFQLMIDANNAQNASLSLLRDILLPKFLSGELILGGEIK